ncbi:MAG: aminoacyl-tRNA hydrolase, partial [Deltaproteobacteria bacterium]|nr:aminoacyl-tRNA hydrolase [Deltaproteobacteria bacterium]
GKKYEKTRHNIGAETLSEFANESGVGLEEKKFSSLFGKGKAEGTDLLLLLPQTFMNRSGEAVKAVLDYYRVPAEEVLVIHDDIDLDLGRLKLDFDAGAAGHRGVLSVIEMTGTQVFHRLRMGIGRPLMRDEVENYVLSPFSTEEEEKVQAMRKMSVKMIKQWIRGEN